MSWISIAKIWNCEPCSNLFSCLNPKLIINGWIILLIFSPAQSKLNVKIMTWICLEYFSRILIRLSSLNSRNHGLFRQNMKNSRFLIYWGNWWICFTSRLHSCPPPKRQPLWYWSSLPWGVRILICILVFVFSSFLVR